MSTVSSSLEKNLSAQMELLHPGIKIKTDLTFIEIDLAILRF